MFTQLQAFWKGLSRVRKTILVGLLSLVFSGLGYLILSRQSTPYRYLYTDMSPEDITEVTNYLRANNFDNYVIDKGGIKVPEENLLKLRVSLSQEGLPSHGSVGWEKFD